MSIPTTIRALKTVPGTNNVEVGEVALDQNLGPDDVLSRTLAVGLNPTDWKHSVGGLWGPEKQTVVGCDSVGEVVKVGSNVTHVAKGDRVFGFVFGTSDPTNGSYAEYTRFNKAVVAKIPASMSAVEGASFPIPHLTAVQALYLRLNLARPSSPSTEGKIVLVSGGATAVGHHAIQLAKLSGYKVFATASPANHATVLALGASAVFNYRDADVVAQIKAAAGKEGVSYAVDAVAEQGTTDLCIDAMGSNGGKVVTTLPVSDETSSRRSDVSVEFTLVYTELGYPLTFAKVLNFPAIPADNAGAYEWVSKELPSLLAGWETSKNGSPLYKAQKLRVCEGGLDRIVEGLEIMKAGSYAAEKLVYSLE
ncbi:GroES-like protein [Mrakia frigida]|uniref:zinc-binding alcohol dehydrogenase family protein n=1 Tax=Mrakia frigida TaxID=29902 RepID=UPI003FCC01B5